MTSEHFPHEFMVSVASSKLYWIQHDVHFSNDENLDMLNAAVPLVDTINSGGHSHAHIRCVLSISSLYFSCLFKKREIYIHSDFFF